MAITAPKVQSLSQAMAALNPAYSGQLSLINQQQAGLGAKYDAQRAGMTAEKGLGFNAINNQATGRGGSFSGVPVDEQATYLSTKYLPGMQMANYQQNEEKMSFQKEAAALKAEQRMQALGRIDKQKSDLNSWNMQVQSQQAQAREAEKQRQFQAAQAASERAFSAAQAASARAYEQSQKGPDNATVIGKLNAWTKGKVGGDKKLSPSDFRAGFQVAAKYGMDADTYQAVMSKYVNTSHKKDYYF